MNWDFDINFHSNITVGIECIVNIELVLYALIGAFVFHTVYRENFAPVLFSPSDLRANLKLSQLNAI